MGIYYLLIVISALLFSLQFMFNNGYQKQRGSSLNSTLCFSLYTSLSGMIILLAINKLHLEITLFSAVTAFVYGMANIAMIYFSIKAFQYANLSVYSVFSMIGGMALPFAYGVFCGEELTTVKIICSILIVLSVVMSVNKGEQSKKAIVYYIAVFFMNGMFGVISAFHQSHTDICVDSASFMILTKIASVLISLIWILCLKDRSFAMNGKAIVYSVGYSAFNSIGNLMLLIALLHLPASVQYPMVTGGVIIFALVIDMIRSEPVSKREILAAGVAFVSTVLMAF